MYYGSSIYICVYLEVCIYVLVFNPIYYPSKLKIITNSFDNQLISKIKSPNIVLFDSIYLMPQMRVKILILFSYVQTNFKSTQR